jgi:AcrR family transcriptional regulator
MKDQLTENVHTQDAKISKDSSMITLQAGKKSDSLRKTNQSRAQNMKAVNREAQIIRSAIEYFAIHGFSVSTRDLAKHIGVTQPLIYHYFGSKEKLVERVYQEVFFSQWNPEWETCLSDTSLTIEERLIVYLEDYTQAILRNDWVRLFIFAALNDPQLNQRYIGHLKDKIFMPILKDLRTQQKLDSQPTEEDIELFWGFHSSFFYMGVRLWVYRMKVPADISKIIKLRVRHFLYGYYELHKHSNI